MKTILLLSSLAALSLASCTNSNGSAVPGFYKVSSPLESGSQFGVLVTSSKLPDLVISGGK